MPLIRGVDGARKIISTYLESRLPALWLPLMRIDLGLDDHQLPDPQTFSAYDPFELDLWPKIGTAAVTASDLATVDHVWTEDSPASDQSVALYNMIIFAWCRTPLLADDSWAQPPRQEAMVLRDHMAAAVRMALLDDPSLDHPDNNVQLIIDQMREEYLEPLELASSARWAAGVQWFVPLRVSEPLALAPYGIATTFITETVPVDHDVPLEPEE